MTGFLPGQLLGQYRIIERIGHGGMATVYKAWQPDMDRYVAIKVIESQFLADPEIMSRFQQEVKVISRLEHPHILPVYDFGEFAGMPYLVMRMLEGGTLSAKLKDSPLKLGEIDTVFSQLANGLSYAHEKGVIHRDVKTNNILLDLKGNAFLTDFGIAKLTEGTQNLTSTGTITGTPSYMSPEQAMGRKVGPQSDIFSLGVVLFEMLTGNVPFTAETPLGVMLRMVNEPLPAPSTFRRDIHPAIEKVVLKALAKETANRYLSVQQFLKEWKTAFKESIDHPYTPDPQAPLPSSQAVKPKKDSRKGSGKRRIPKIAWLLSILFVAVISAAILAVRNLLLNSKQNDVPSTGFVQQPGVATNRNENLSPYIKNLIPAAESSSRWQTWGAGNDVRSLSKYGEFLFAGSPGGLIIWDTTDQSYGQITTQSGLPGPLVNEVYPDEDDSIWVATNDGLAHLFQNQIETFQLENGYVSSIDKYESQLIAGTWNSSTPGSGLFAFDGSKWNPVSGFPSAVDSNPNTVSPNINDILSSSEGKLWIGTARGLAVFDGTNWQVFSNSDGLLSNDVLQVFQSNDGIVYVVTPNGISFFDGVRFNPFVDSTSIQLTSLTGISQDDQGNLWISGDGGIAKYNLSTNAWEVFNPANGRLPVEAVTQIIPSSNSRLYFGSDQGILVYDENSSFQLWSATTEIANSLIDRIITIPGEKTWFVNQSSAVVDQYDRASLSWSAFQLTEACCMIPMFYDSDGTILGGGQTGLWIISGDTTIHLTKSENMISDTVTDVGRYGDQQLIIGTDIGVMDIDGTDIIGSFSPTRYSLPSDYVTDILIMPDKTKWVGLKQGLIRIKSDFSIEPFTSENLFSATMIQVSDMAYDSKQQLWITTIGDGIYMMENEKWHHYSSVDGSAPLPTVDVLSVSVDHNDVAWFGLGEYGAISFDGQNWQTITEENGMTLSSVHDVVSLSDGSIWFAGEHGISLYSP